MRKRVLAIAVGIVLSLGAFAVAQTAPFTVRADSIVHEVTWGVGGQTAPVPVQTTLSGNVLFEVNGVLVRADRAVIKDGEVVLEGNVRLTLPTPK